MTVGTKIAIGVAATACVACGVFLWALTDLCRRIGEIDYGSYEESPCPWKQAPAQH